MDTWDPTDTRPAVAFPRADVIDLHRFLCPICRRNCRCTGHRANETDQVFTYVCRNGCRSTYEVTVRAEPSDAEPA